MLLIDANEKRKMYFSAIVDGYPVFTHTRGNAAEIGAAFADTVIRQLQRLCPQRLIVVDPGPGVSYRQAPGSAADLRQ